MSPLLHLTFRFASGAVLLFLCMYVLLVQNDWKQLARYDSYNTVNQKKQDRNHWPKRTQTSVDSSCACIQPAAFPQSSPTLSAGSLSSKEYPLATLHITLLSTYPVHTPIHMKTHPNSNIKVWLGSAAETVGAAAEIMKCCAVSVLTSPPPYNSIYSDRIA